MENKTKERSIGKGVESRKDYYERVIVRRYRDIFGENLARDKLLIYMRKLDDDWGPVTPGGEISWGRGDSVVGD
ncbi:hypothetical protein CMI47_18545 [Candidatus Pacearchaeota archaeon]|nr:hypothetical protein [Candidatus Pacearchaeota archaeon]|tara:strand:+ start:914 stop:1135 length:222 start_codon:yes stop_codon:yes gene_type:complete